MFPNPKRAFRSISWLAVGAALGVPLGACTSNVDERLALARIDSSCRLNSDCESPLVCAFERCHQQCAASRDCRAGERCVAGSQGRHVCQLPREKDCSNEGACAGSQVCGIDAQCRDACVSDAGCLAEQVCSTGVCAERAELRNGQLTASTERSVAVPLPCALNSDCPAPFVCGGGTCRAQCSANRDCEPQEECRDARCVEVTDSSVCRYNSDCAADEICEGAACAKKPVPQTGQCARDTDCPQPGQHCLDGACTCECRDERDCGPRQICSDACACVTTAVAAGDVIVTNLKQLAELDGVEQIAGKLSIQLPGPGIFHVPSLRQVDSVDTSGTGAQTTLVFDALESANGFICQGGACVLSQLETVGDLSWSGSTNQQIDLPRLSVAKSMLVRNNADLRTLHLPSLTMSSSVELTANPRLVDFQASELVAVETLVINGNAALASLTLPRAVPSSLLNIQYNPALKVVSLPAVMSSVDAAQLPTLSVLIWSDDQLETLDLSGLSLAKTVQVLRLPKLTSLDLASLVTVDGKLELSQLPGPVTLALPALRSAGPWELSLTTAIQTVECPRLERLGRLDFVGNRLSELTLPSLTTVTSDLRIHGEATLVRVAFPSLASAATDKNATALFSGTGLAQLELPAVTQLGNLLIAATQLTELDSLTRPPGPDLNVASVQIVSNPALSDCAIESLQASPGTHVTGVFTYEGNLACP